MYYYYDELSGTSVWDRPTTAPPQPQPQQPQQPQPGPMFPDMAAQMTSSLTSDASCAVVSSAVSFGSPAAHHGGISREPVLVANNRKRAAAVTGM